MLTRAQKNIIEEALQLELEEAKSAGVVGYMARVLTQATLPHKDPKSRFFERSNGLLTVNLADVHNVGLPYGTRPRLLLAWLTTEAVRQRDKHIVLGDSLSHFMRQLGLVPTGGRWGTIQSLKTQIARLFSCAIGYKIEDDSGLHLATTVITKEVHLWWDTKTPDQTSLFDSHIILDQDFFDEIIDRPVPVDMRALNALKRSPLALDIYTWLTYRMSYLNKKTAISWAQLQLQFGAGYSFDRAGLNNFQKHFVRELKKVQSVYPAVNLDIVRGRLILLPSPPNISKIGS